MSRWGLHPGLSVCKDSLDEWKVPLLQNLIEGRNLKTKNKKQPDKICISSSGINVI